MSAVMPLTGDLASMKAKAQKAYQDALAQVNVSRAQMMQRYGYNPDGSLSNNKYGSYQQIQHDYSQQKQQLDDSRARFEGDYGIKMDGNGGYTESGDDGQLQRLKTDHDTFMSRLQDARNKTQFQSGLKASFDPSGKPTSLTLGGDNEYSDYKRMLGNESMDLSSAEDSARARGLGGKGYGAQAVKALEWNQGGERQDYRNSILDALTGLGQQGADENTDYNRTTADLKKSITDAIKAFTQQGSDLDYQKGLSEYNLGLDLSDKNAALDQQKASARSGFDDITEWLASNPVLGAAGGGTDGKGSTSDNAGPSASNSTDGIKWAGQTVTSKGQMASILARSGVMYDVWAKQHPAAAAKLK